MSEFWEWVVGVSGASVVFVFLGRAVVGQLFARDLERFKSELQRAAALELERQKVELRKGAVEHETAFRWLHAKQADAVEDLYAKFIGAASAIEAAISTAAMMEIFGGGRTVFEAPVEMARDALREFKEALKGYRPIIPEDLDGILTDAEDVLDRHMFSVVAYDGALLMVDETGVKPQLLKEGVSADEELRSLERQVVGALRRTFSEKA